jgi:hypothetical protein
MSAVIDMKSWKESHTPSPPPKAAPASPSSGEMLYFCRACDSERFRIFESGVVRCAQCDAELHRAPASLFTLAVLPFLLPFRR